VWAAEASDVSLLHALFYAHSNAGLERVRDTNEGMPGSSRLAR